MTVLRIYVPACVEHIGAYIEHAGVCVKRAISILLLFETMIEQQ